MLISSLLLALVGSACAAEVVCTALANAKDGRLLVERGDCGRRVTPASTFKIAISLMGYDVGFLTDMDSPALPFQQGDPDWNPAWRTTVDPARWMRDSVVWYSQRVTRAIGAQRFGSYVAQFGYGNADVSGDAGQANGLTRAWLSSSLAISPLEQITFLNQLVRRELSVSPNAYAMTGSLTRLGGLPGGWEIHGKTGTGFPRNPDGSLDRNHGYGWFVGWAQRDSETVTFARLTQDSGPEAVPAGLRARDAMLAEIPRLLADTHL